MDRWQAPLSKMLIVPFASMVASCWKAVVVPAASLKDECLPPMRDSTWPVCVFSSYSAQVLRAEISDLPPASCWTELRWKESNGQCVLVSTGDL